jgi:hypothetical protein
MIVSARDLVSRLTIPLVLATVLGACAPERTQLSGEFVQGEGVMVGRGTFTDGTEWNVHARTDSAGLLCISSWLSQGPGHGVSCSALANRGWVGGVEVSFACGASTIAAGSFDVSVTSVRVESTVGVQEIALVPLRAMGLPSVAFGFAVPPGARLLSVTTLDATGTDIERTEIPPAQCRP